MDRSRSSSHHSRSSLSSRSNHSPHQRLDSPASISSHKSYSYKEEHRFKSHHSDRHKHKRNHSDGGRYHERYITGNSTYVRKTYSRDNFFKDDSIRDHVNHHRHSHDKKNDFEKDRISDKHFSGVSSQQGKNNDIHAKDQYKTFSSHAVNKPMNDSNTSNHSNITSGSKIDKIAFLESQLKEEKRRLQLKEEQRIAYEKKLVDERRTNKQFEIPFRNEAHYTVDDKADSKFQGNLQNTHSSVTGTKETFFNTFSNKDEDCKHDNEIESVKAPISNDQYNFTAMEKQPLSYIEADNDVNEKERDMEALEKKIKEDKKAYLEKKIALEKQALLKKKAILEKQRKSAELASGVESQKKLIEKFQKSNELLTQNIQALVMWNQLNPLYPQSPSMQSGLSNIVQVMPQIMSQSLKSPAVSVANQTNSKVAVSSATHKSATNRAFQNPAPVFVKNKIANNIAIQSSVSSVTLTTQSKYRITNSTSKIKTTSLKTVVSSYQDEAQKVDNKSEKKNYKKYDLCLPVSSTSLPSNWNTNKSVTMISPMKVVSTPKHTTRTNYSATKVKTTSIPLMSNKSNSSDINNVLKFPNLSATKVSANKFSTSITDSSSKVLSHSVSSTPTSTSPIAATNKYSNDSYVMSNIDSTKLASSSAKVSPTTLSKPSKGYVKPSKNTKNLEAFNDKISTSKKQSISNSDDPSVVNASTVCCSSPSPTTQSVVTSQSRSLPTTPRMGMKLTFLEYQKRKKEGISSSLPCSPNIGNKAVNNGIDKGSIEDEYKAFMSSISTASNYSKNIDIKDVTNVDVKTPENSPEGGVKKSILKNHKKNKQSTGTPHQSNLQIKEAQAAKEVKSEKTNDDNSKTDVIPTNILLVTPRNDIRDKLQNLAKLRMTETKMIDSIKSNAMDSVSTSNLDRIKNPKSKPSPKNINEHPKFTNKENITEDSDLSNVEAKKLLKEAVINDDNLCIDNDLFEKERKIGQKEILFDSIPSDNGQKDQSCQHLEESKEINSLQKNNQQEKNKLKAKEEIPDSTKSTDTHLQQVLQTKDVTNNETNFTESSEMQEPQNSLSASNEDKNFFPNDDDNSIPDKDVNFISNESVNVFHNENRNVIPYKDINVKNENIFDTEQSDLKPTSQVVGANSPNYLTESSPVIGKRKSKATLKKQAFLEELEKSKKRYKKKQNATKQTVSMNGSKNFVNNFKESENENEPVLNEKEPLQEKKVSDKQDNIKHSLTKEVSIDDTSKKESVFMQEDCPLPPLKARTPKKRQSRKRTYSSDTASDSTASSVHSEDSKTKSKEQLPISQIESKFKEPASANKKEKTIKDQDSKPPQSKMSNKTPKLPAKPLDKKAEIEEKLVVKSQDLTFDSMVKFVLNTPAKEKKFKCKSCEAVFWKEQELKNHSLIHKLKTYDCYKCDAKFTNMRALTKHLLVHNEMPRVISSTRPHDCDRCGEKFETENQLLVHLQIHDMKELDHVCAFCSAKYHSLSELYAHIQVKHPKGMQEVLKCSLCSVQFKNLGEFRIHLLKIHHMSNKEATLASRNKGIVPEEYRVILEEKKKKEEKKNKDKGLLLRSGNTVREKHSKSNSGKIIKRTKNLGIQSKAKKVIQQSKKVQRIMKSSRSSDRIKKLISQASIDEELNQKNEKENLGKNQISFAKPKGEKKPEENIHETAHPISDIKGYQDIPNEACKKVEESSKINSNSNKNTNAEGDNKILQREKLKRSNRQPAKAKLIQTDENAVSGDVVRNTTGRKKDVKRVETEHLSGKVDETEAEKDKSEKQIQEINAKTRSKDNKISSEIVAETFKEISVENSFNNEINKSQEKEEKNINLYEAQVKSKETATSASSEREKIIRLKEINDKHIVDVDVKLDASEKSLSNEKLFDELPTNKKPFESNQVKNKKASPKGEKWKRPERQTASSEMKQRLRSNSAEKKLDLKQPVSNDLSTPLVNQVQSITTKPVSKEVKIQKANTKAIVEKEVIKKKKNQPVTTREDSKNSDGVRKLDNTLDKPSSLEKSSKLAKPRYRNSSILRNKISQKTISNQKRRKILLFGSNNKSKKNIKSTPVLHPQLEEIKTLMKAPAELPSLLPETTLDAIYDRVQKQTKKISQSIPSPNKLKIVHSSNDKLKVSTSQVNSQHSSNNGTLLSRKMHPDVEKIRLEEAEKRIKQQFESAERTARMLIRNQRRKSDESGPSKKKKKKSPDSKVIEKARQEPIKVKVHIKMSDYVTESTAILPSPVTTPHSESPEVSFSDMVKTNSKSKRKSKDMMIDDTDTSAKVSLKSVKRRRKKYYVYEDELLAKQISEKSPIAFVDPVNKTSSILEVDKPSTSYLPPAHKSPDPYLEQFKLDSQDEYSNENEEVFLTKDDLSLSLMTLVDASHHGNKTVIESLDRENEYIVKTLLTNLLDVVAGADHDSSGTIKVQNKNVSPSKDVGSLKNLLDDLVEAVEIDSDLQNKEKKNQITFESSKTFTTKNALENLLEVAEKAEKEATMYFENECSFNYDSFSENALVSLAEVVERQTNLQLKESCNTDKDLYTKNALDEFSDLVLRTEVSKSNCETISFSNDDDLHATKELGMEAKNNILNEFCDLVCQKETLPLLKRFPQSDETERREDLFNMQNDTNIESECKTQLEELLLKVCENCDSGFEDVTSCTPDSDDFVSYINQRSYTESLSGVSHSDESHQDAYCNQQSTNDNGFNEAITCRIDSKISQNSATDHSNALLRWEESIASEKRNIVNKPFYVENTVSASCEPDFDSFNFESDVSLIKQILSDIVDDVCSVENTSNENNSCDAINIVNSLTPFRNFETSLHEIDETSSLSNVVIKNEPSDFEDVDEVLVEFDQEESIDDKHWFQKFNNVRQVSSNKLYSCDRNIGAYQKIKPFKCLSCAKAFIKQSSYINHSCFCQENPQSRAKKKKKLFQCSKCGLVFTKKSHLSLHTSNHDNISNISCIFCGAIFESNILYKLHLTRRHSFTKAYQCIVCSQHYSSNYNLQTHICISNFKCMVCGLNFSSKNTLKRHELFVHTQNNNLNKCLVCGQRFMRRSYLMSHMKSHDGILPFRCLYCHKDFRQQNNLYKHVEGCHKKKLSLECT